MRWPEAAVPTPNGILQGIAPLVISASRVTDIPAFHGKWLMDRLEAGYCTWVNPFNAGQRQYISFERCRVLVFWTKNPEPLMPYLQEIEARDIQFYFQFSLNDYGSGIEPGLPVVKERIRIFRELSKQIGAHRIIWRYDPIILGGSLTVENTLERLYGIGREIAAYTEKLVFSFVDWYRKTERNLRMLDPTLRPPSEEEMQQIARGILEVERALPTRLKLATCAEVLDLQRLGIKHNKCIDPELLLRLCPDCREFQNFCRKSVPNVNQAILPGITVKFPLKSSKDSGQRKACGCAPGKDIGMYDTCRHFCAYCYANQSEEAVLSRLHRMMPNYYPDGKP